MSAGTVWVVGLLSLLSVVAMGIVAVKVRALARDRREAAPSAGRLPRSVGRRAR